jgi:hypothetical protein
MHFGRYHSRRAAAERTLANETDDSNVAAFHKGLAEIHDHMLARHANDILAPERAVGG